ncbi:MAG TPA: glutaredoxin [Candidatus Tumulicola sp.]|nr:glutaredoxin [Candidatus Tumulicola sp.]
MPLELYGTQACPYTADLRAELDWDAKVYVEYDVETDAQARARLFALTAGAGGVPVLVENGRVVQVGYNGRSCYVTAGPP